jgi:hypothetical protein
MITEYIGLREQSHEPDFEGGGGNFVANPQVQLPAPFKAGYANRSVSLFTNPDKKA